MTDLSNAPVIKVYSGKIGCLCGCRGIWRYTKHGAENHNPGYQPTISEKSVAKIAKEVLSHPDRVVDGDIVYYDQDGKTKIVYLDLTGQVSPQA